MSTINPNDEFIVQRSTTSHKVSAENLMSTINKDTDWLLIQRGENSFKVSASDVYEQLGPGGDGVISAPVVASIDLTENDTEGSRFSSQSFTITPTFTEPGNPTPIKSYKAQVAGSLRSYAITQKITKPWAEVAGSVNAKGPVIKAVQTGVIENPVYAAVGSTGYTAANGTAVDNGTGDPYFVNCAPAGTGLNYYAEKTNDKLFEGNLSTYHWYLYAASGEGQCNHFELELSRFGPITSIGTFSYHSGYVPWTYAFRYDDGSIDDPQDIWFKSPAEYHEYRPQDLEKTPTHIVFERPFYSTSCGWLINGWYVNGQLLENNKKYQASVVELESEEGLVNFPVGTCVKSDKRHWYAYPPSKKYYDPAYPYSNGIGMPVPDINAVAVWQGGLGNNVWEDDSSRYCVGYWDFGSNQSWKLYKYYQSGLWVSADGKNWINQQTILDDATQSEYFTVVARYVYMWGYYAGTWIPNGRDYGDSVVETINTTGPNPILGISGPIDQEAGARIESSPNQYAGKIEFEGGDNLDKIGNSVAIMTDGTTNSKGEYLQASYTPTLAQAVSAEGPSTEAVGNNIIQPGTYPKTYSTIWSTTFDDEGFPTGDSGGFIDNGGDPYWYDIEGMETLEDNNERQFEYSSYVWNIFDGDYGTHCYFVGKFRRCKFDLTRFFDGDDWESVTVRWRCYSSSYPYFKPVLNFKGGVAREFPGLINDGTVRSYTIYRNPAENYVPESISFNGTGKGSYMYLYWIAVDDKMIVQDFNTHGMRNDCYTLTFAGTAEEDNKDLDYIEPLDVLAEDSNYLAIPGLISTVGVSPGSWTSGYSPAEKLFFGFRQAESYNYVSGSSNSAVIKLVFNGSYPYSQPIPIKYNITIFGDNGGYQAESYKCAYSITVDGVVYTQNTAGQPWASFDVSGLLTEITVQKTSAALTYFTGFRVDGRLAIDPQQAAKPIEDYPSCDASYKPKYTEINSCLVVSTDVANNKMVVTGEQGKPVPKVLEPTPFKIPYSYLFQYVNGSNAHIDFQTESNRRTWTMAFWRKSGYCYRNQFICYMNRDDKDPERSFWIKQYMDKSYQVFVANTLMLETDTNEGTDTRNFLEYQCLREWGHVQFVCDTTAATPQERFKILFNGVEATYTTDKREVYLTKDIELGWGLRYDHYLGEHEDFATSEYHLEGYMSQWYYIDGKACGPNDLTEKVFDILRPKAPDALGFSLTGNSFYLPLSDGTTSETLTKDMSGLNNDWEWKNVPVAVENTADPKYFSSDGRWNYVLQSPDYYAVNYKPQKQYGAFEMFNTSDYGNNCMMDYASTSGYWYWTPNSPAMKFESTVRILVDTNTSGTISRFETVFNTSQNDEITKDHSNFANTGIRWLNVVEAGDINNKYIQSVYFYKHHSGSAYRRVYGLEVDGVRMLFGDTRKDPMSIDVPSVSGDPSAVGGAGNCNWPTLSWYNPCSSLSYSSSLLCGNLFMVNYSAQFYASAVPTYSGKWYMEWTVTHFTEATYVNSWEIGVVPGPVNTGNYKGQTIGSAYQQGFSFKGNGKRNFSGTETAFDGGSAHQLYLNDVTYKPLEGCTYRMMFDQDEGKLWIAKEDKEPVLVWSNMASKGMAYYMACSPYYMDTWANFGQKQFKYEVPENFKCLRHGEPGTYLQKDNLQGVPLTSEAFVVGTSSDDSQYCAYFDKEPPRCFVGENAAGKPFYLANDKLVDYTGLYLQMDDDNKVVAISSIDPGYRVTAQENPVFTFPSSIDGQDLDVLLPAGTGITASFRAANQAGSSEASDSVTPGQVTFNAQKDGDVELYMDLKRSMETIAIAEAETRLQRLKVLSEIPEDQLKAIEPFIKIK